MVTPFKFYCLTFFLGVTKKTKIRESLGLPKIFHNPENASIHFNANYYTCGFCLTLKKNYSRCSHLLDFARLKSISL